MKILRRIFAEELPFFLACPALVWQIFFLFLPFCLLVLYSLSTHNSVTNAFEFSLFFYRQVIHSSSVHALANSFLLALITSVICFFFAYPIAYFLAVRVSKKYRTLLLFLLILPSWTSIVVQVYAWFFLLEKNSLFTQFLYKFGILSESYHFLNKYFTILIGMVSTYLPFMVLPVYATLEKMDKELLEASADLGADKFETFKRIVFPLSLPGAYAGILLVFIPSFGEYAIPTLLGGSKYVFWGSVIVDRFLRSRDWSSGSALAVLGVLIPSFLIAVSYVINKIIIRRNAIKVKGDGVSSEWHKDHWQAL